MENTVLDDIIVIDNCVHPVWADDFEKALLESDFPWYYNRSSNYPTKVSNRSELNHKNIIDSAQLTHSFLHSDGSMSSAFPLVANLLSASPFSIKKLLRIKANLVSYSHSSSENSHGVPHTDYETFIKDMVTCLYYVTDSSGDTVLFKEFNTGGKECNTFTVEKTITPKKGRMVVFDGNRYHAANTPRNDDPRVVVNINFTVYQKNKLFST